MKVNLPGVNAVRKRLTSGGVAVHYYAWRGKGAPKLLGEPGSPEFIKSYHDAHATRPAHHDGTLQAVINAYQATPHFSDLAPTTRTGYKAMIRVIEREFGDLPIPALADRRMRAEFLNWRDTRATTSRRQADAAMTVLALILSWAADRGLVPCNPVQRPGRTYRADRNDAVWQQDDETRFLATCPAHLRLAYLLASRTGQRQKDLLTLTWAAYDGNTIRLRQSKGGRRVTIPLTTDLRQAMDKAKATRRGLTILETTRGTPWTSDGFKTSWGKATRKAGIEGLTFHDLRGTAITRLALAGCTVPEIATITGHSLKTVEALLDAHYLHRDPALSESAIRKLDAHRNRTGLQTALQTVPVVAPAQASDT